MKAMFNVPVVAFIPSGLIRFPTVNSQATLAQLPTFGILKDRSFITFSNNTDAPATAAAPLGQTWQLSAKSLTPTGTTVQPLDHNLWPSNIRAHLFWQLC